MAEAYHVENFRLLVNTVVDRYGDILNDDDLRFAHCYAALPASARSLFTRLITRQAPLFRASTLHYDDVTDTLESLQHLATEGFVLLNDADIQLYFSVSTKVDIATWFSADHKIKKTQLIQSVIDTLHATEILERFHRQDLWVAVLHREIVNKLCLCFFGNARQNLSEFVITQLGHVKYETYEFSAQTRYFNDAGLLNHSLQLYQLHSRLDTDLKGATLDTLLALETEIPPALDDARYQRRRARVFYQLGREAERRKETVQALRLYAQADNDASLERQVRIYLGQGQADAATLPLERLLEQCTDPEIRANACRLANRLASLQASEKRFTQHEPLVEKVILSPDAGRIEDHVANHFTGADAHCIYTENVWFNGLLGLLFWDIIFLPQVGAFANAFQRGPLDLYEKTFYASRKNAIDERLNALLAGQGPTLMETHLHAKKGLANTLVNWEYFERIPWREMISVFPPTHLFRIVSRMLEDLGQHRAGFPDLLFWNGSHHYRLLEVKGPHDRLRENQRAWLAYFAQHDIPAAVVQVCYAAAQE